MPARSLDVKSASVVLMSLHGICVSTRMAVTLARRKTPRPRRGLPKRKPHPPQNVLEDEARGQPVQRMLNGSLGKKAAMTSTHTHTRIRISKHRVHTLRTHMPTPLHLLALGNSRELLTDRRKCLRWRYWPATNCMRCKGRNSKAVVVADICIQTLRVALTTAILQWPRTRQVRKETTSLMAQPLLRQPPLLWSALLAALTTTATEVTISA